MTTFVLSKATVASATVAAALAAGQAQAVNPANANNVPNPQTQAFEAVGTCTSGNVSATIQIYVSNDGNNWIAYGSAITLTSGASPQIGSVTGASPWQYYTAVVTAISGTGALVTVTMAC